MIVEQNNQEEETLILILHIFIFKVYPYSHIQSYEQLDNEKQLPSREAFYNHLYNEEVGEDDYIHAQNVWDSLGFTSLRNFAECYQIFDVLILADVFEDFRKLSMEVDHLDPLW